MAYINSKKVFTVNKTTYIGENINLDATPKGVYVNLAALQAAYPTGAEGVYLTSDNGHWYYYQNGWQDGGVYQAVDIGAGSISRDNLNNDLKYNNDNGIKANKVFDYFKINGNLIPYGVLETKLGFYCYKNGEGQIQFDSNPNYNVYKIDYKENVNFYNTNEFRFIDIVDINNNVLVEYESQNTFNSGNYANAKYIYVALYAVAEQVISKNSLKTAQDNFISPIFSNKFGVNYLKLKTNLIPYDVLETKLGFYCYKNGEGQIQFDSNPNYNVFKFKYEPNTAYYGNYIRFFEIVDANGVVLLEVEDVTLQNSGNYANAKYIYISLPSADYTFLKNYNTLPIINLPTSAKNISISATCNIGDQYLKLKLCNASQDVINYVNVTSTEIIVWNYLFGTPYETRVNHNLTIEHNIQLNVDIINGSSCNITLISNGELFEWNTSFDKMQVTFLAVETGESSADISISFAINDVLKKNWIFGDSYVSSGNDRWVNYLYNSTYDNYLIDGYSGEGSSNSLISLKNLLKVFKPENVCWFLGMNDGNDTNNTTPPTGWLNALNEVINLSKTYGFNLILATIPTVPTVNNEGKNYVVRNSGYQYVDFAKAVGANAAGAWFTGMLSSDEVHPTIKGAKALYGQFLSDFPQIKIKN